MGGRRHLRNASLTTWFPSLGAREHLATVPRVAENVGFHGQQRKSAGCSNSVRFRPLRMLSFPPLRRLLSTVASCLIALTPARAVILLGTGDPAANTTAPGGTLANSGWQYQGTFSGFLGTPIAPNFFITAAHIGGAVGTPFVFQGVTHTTVAVNYDPYSDLVIWQVDGTFPNFAPLYSTPTETGQPLVVFGRGTQRGAAVIKNGTQRGWLWGAGDGVQRWGENVVTSIVSGGLLQDYIYATFDATGSPNEAHLSVGDSAGAVFIKDGTVWKLAGINYAVDGPFYTTNTGDGAFNAALYDSRDFYQQDSENPPVYSLI